MVSTIFEPILLILLFMGVSCSQHNKSQTGPSVEMESFGNLPDGSPVELSSFSANAKTSLGLVFSGSEGGN